LPEGIGVSRPEHPARAMAATVKSMTMPDSRLFFVIVRSRALRRPQVCCGAATAESSPAENTSAGNTGVA